MRLKHDRRVNLNTVKSIFTVIYYDVEFHEKQGAVTVLQFMQVINKQHTGMKHVFL